MELRISFCTIPPLNNMCDKSESGLETDRIFLYFSGNGVVFSSNKPH